MQISVAAEVAIDCVQLRAFQQRIWIARDNLRTQQRTAELTRQKLAGGLLGALDVPNADALAQSSQGMASVAHRSRHGWQSRQRNVS